jgi:hypothetical protein
MSLLPTSNGPTTPKFQPPIHSPLPPQLPGQPSHDVSQPNARDIHSNNLRHPESFNGAGFFPPSVPYAPPGPVEEGLNLDSHSITNVRPPPDVTWPGAVPPPSDGPSQYTSISTNQTSQAACICDICVAHHNVGPIQFGGGEPVLASQNATTAPSAPAPSSSSQRGLTAPDPGARPPALHTQIQHPDIIDAGLVGVAQHWQPRPHPPIAETGYAHTSMQIPPVRIDNPRRPREVPLVRVEDRIEWVRRDLLKMTLWFNWSLDAEAHAHEPWGELLDDDDVPPPPGGSVTVSSVPALRRSG